VITGFPDVKKLLGFMSEIRPDTGTWFADWRLSSVAKLYAGEFTLKDSAGKTKILGALAMQNRKSSSGILSPRVDGVVGPSAKTSKGFSDWRLSKLIRE
jgi:hypothetical protein